MTKVNRLIKLVGRATFVLVVLSTSTAPLMAQTSIEPFDSLVVRLGVSRNVSSDGLLEIWRPGSALSLEASTPFHAGRVGTGFRYEFWTGRLAELPSFRSIYVHISWGAAWRGLHSSAHEAGVHLGDFFMMFDDDELFNVRAESELGAGAYYRIHMRLSKRLGFFIQGSYTGVLTHKRLNLFHVTSGFDLRAATPGWLRSFLR